MLPNGIGLFLPSIPSSFIVVVPLFMEQLLHRLSRGRYANYRMKKTSIMLIFCPANN